MPRPENKIPGDGPIAQLAQELRQVRDRAGRRPYRQLAADTHFSASVLAEAAAGYRCPTWEVTKAFVLACGAETEGWYQRWLRAHAEAPSRRVRSPKRAVKIATDGRFEATLPARLPLRPTRPPDPSMARTPAEYVRQLRALRAWAGKPGSKDIARAGRELGLLPPSPRDGTLPSSTLYDALNPRRVSLPPLRIVQMIVEACGAWVPEWTAAWQAIALRQFDEENPPLAAGKGQKEHVNPAGAVGY
jgi:hypothetical protein